jgi:Arc/MetJ family transcription regulator
MRLSVTLDEKLLNEVVKVSGAKTKRAAIEQALRHYVQTYRLEELAMMIEKRPLDLSQADLKKWRQSAHVRT